MRKSELAGVVPDDVLAARRIEHDFRLLELAHIIVEAPHVERLRRKEAVPARRVARGDAVDRKRHDVGFLGLRPERRDDRMQRAHPGEPAVAPAHGLRPGKRAHDDGQHLGQHGERRAAGLLHQRDIEVALLGVALDRRLGERAQSGAPQKALHRRVGRADARPLPLFPQVRLAGGNPLHEQREPARRRERLRPLVDEARIDEALGHELAQILRRPRLHAGRDFLGEQLKQKVGHVWASTC